MFALNGSYEILEGDFDAAESEAVGCEKPLVLQDFGGSLAD